MEQVHDGYKIATTDKGFYLIKEDYSDGPFETKTLQVLLRCDFILKVKDEYRINPKLIK